MFSVKRKTSASADTDEPTLARSKTASLDTCGESAASRSADRASVGSKVGVAPRKLERQLTKAEMQHEFKQLLDAAVLLQKWWRRRRWLQVMGHGLPLVRAPCGLITLFPMYSRHLELQGVQGLKGMNRVYYGRSLGCLGPANPLRLVVVAIVESDWFDALTLTIVALNCIELAMLGPPNQPHAPYHDVIDAGATWYFTVELVLKVVAMGFAGHEHACVAPPPPRHLAASRKASDGRHERSSSARRHPSRAAH